jgi:di/tricarboxylate transporter
MSRAALQCAMVVLPAAMWLVPPPPDLPVAAWRLFAGFANGTILLIVLTFLVARAVVTSGLGTRIGHLMVGLFGGSAMGLSYSIFLVDGIIAPAFPGNTAAMGIGGNARSRFDRHRVSRSWRALDLGGVDTRGHRP